MSFTSYSLYFIIVLCIAIRKGYGASIEIIPGETVPPDTSTLTLKCITAPGSDITAVYAINLYKGVQHMASISIGNPPQLQIGFDSIKYTVSGNMPDLDPMNFLQVVIANPDCSDGAEYTCRLTANNNDGLISPNPEDLKAVTVQTKPSDLVFSVNPEEIIYFEDNIVTITCSGKVGDPALPWVWERKLSGSNWEPYPDSSDITNGALVPPGTDECSFTQDSVLTKLLKSSDNDMSLRCLINGAEVREKVFTVYYGASVVTLTPPTVDPVLEGGDMISVTCSHDDCNPYCEQEWYKDENLVLTSNGILDLTNVDRSRAGIYICKASNPTIPGNEITQSLNLEVYYGPSEVTLIPSSVDVVFEGDDMTPVTCNHDVCNPYCERNWYKDDNLITNNGVLELTNVDRLQAGSYICKVFNPTIPGSEMTQSLSLEVNYGPSSVYLTPPSIDPIIEGNDMTPVTCHGDCNPPCVIEWYKDATLISGHGVLELVNVNRLQAGSYLCKVSYSTIPGSDMTTTLNVEVYYGPNNVFLAPASIAPIIEGNDMTPVTCSHDECNPSCKIEWYKDVKLITDIALLELAKVNRSQAGTYICTVLNPEIPDSEVTQDLAVKVYYGPDFIHINSSETVGLIEFEDLAPIPCLTSCYPECDIKWYNGSIDDGNLIDSLNGELELFNVSRSQQDIFYCEVSHPLNPDRRLNDSIDLQVYYGPEFVQLTPDSIGSVAEGSFLQVLCLANCNPFCQFTWYYQSENHLNMKTNTGGELNFPNINRNEAGLYTCEVNHAEIVNSSQTVEIEIRVHCVSSEIQITAEPSKDVYDEDEVVILTCTGDFSSGTDPSWKWQKSSSDNDWVDYVDFTVSDPSDDGCSYQQVTTLSITITSDDDGSDIRCIKDENEDLSQLFKVNVGSNDQNGCRENYAVSSMVLFSLLVLIHC